MLSVSCHGNRHMTLLLPIPVIDVVEAKDGGLFRTSKNFCVLPVIMFLGGTEEMGAGAKSQKAMMSLFRQ